MKPCIEEIDIVLVDEATVLDIQRCVCGCEHCAENAAISFDYLLDALTDRDPAITEYLMYSPAKCQTCSANITEKTLVVIG